ncbi:MAG: NADH-quinone oxidoreductase subunit F, partial [Thermotaleaceae bacterium]
MKIVVGLGSCGMAAGAGKVYEAIEQEIEEKKLQAEVQLTGCIGMCHLEPIVDIIDGQGFKTTYVKVTPENAVEIINKAIVEQDSIRQYEIEDEDKKILQMQKRIAIRNCGYIDPEDIQEYIQAGGYKAIENCIRNRTPQEIIEEIKISGLRGRGGAGFPTWFKWNAARQSADTPKYIVCNADEGDPGAFMDRSILEGDPHSLIEGMLIGGYAIGAEYGIIYVRAEYPLAIVRLEKAI